MRPDTIKLQGFNNLNKTLSFSFYDVSFVGCPEAAEDYQAYINERYNTDRLTVILNEVAAIIGAKILNVARQDYEPQGGSVTMMVCDDSLSPPVIALPVLNASGKWRVDDLVMHLDKSHLTVHTYPENYSDKGIHTFRTDIEVSTCGCISPLKTLNYLIRSLESDIVTLDYRVRGFTRDTMGRKHFIDHAINSIQNFMAPDISQRFQMMDVNLAQVSMFHTKMLLKTFDVESYLFERGKSGRSDDELRQIEQLLNTEMSEIFNGCNTVAI